MDMTVILPEECISHIISLMSPRDACRSSVVSSAFKSAADSDAVWKSFLPSDYQEIISNSNSSSSILLASMSKKELYFHLCHNPILISNATMSFAIEKESGKKCFMIGARGLSIEWGDTPKYWVWTSLPDSRFSEVAELKLVWLLDIKGRIDSKFLSPKTTYATYLVFKLVETRYGFEERSVKLQVYFEGRRGRRKRQVVLDPAANRYQQSRNRGDGWMEIKMGEIFIEHGDGGEVVCTLFDFDAYRPKHGLIVQGIEFRPKTGR